MFEISLDTYGPWKMREVTADVWVEETISEQGLYLNLSDRPYHVTGEHRPTKRRFALVALGNKDRLFVIHITKSRKARYFLGEL